MKIKIVPDKITIDEVRQMAADTYGDMVKGVADVQRAIMAIGGEWHADAEALLLEDGSAQENLWGFNIYPEKDKDSRIAFVSLINIRPRQNNRGMEIIDITIRKQITEIVNNLILL